MSTKSLMGQAQAALYVPQGPPLPHLRKNGARLIALDGGGVKGVSSVLILDEIMMRVKRIEHSRGITSQASRKPVDYFDMGAGTSTGGLIALMLFRLRMDMDQCRQVYHRLASRIFAPTFLGNKALGRIFGGFGLIMNAVFLKSKFPKAPLEHCIREVVDEYPIKPKDPDKDYLVHPQSGMMFMCATLKDKGESLLLRSYQQPKDAKPISRVAKEISTGPDGGKYINSIQIVSAARATSAAPVYLPEEVWKTPAGEITFWDGGVLNNNPVEQLWNARYDLVKFDEPPPPVSVVLSLGCGWAEPSKPWFHIRLLRTITRFSESYLANTEAKHRDFQRLVQRMTERGDQNNDTKYFRFNVSTGTQHFDMADPTIMAPLEALTQAYIKQPDVSRRLDEVAELLASED